jgi:hypothetical protein
MTRAARLSCCLIALLITLLSAQDTTSSRTKYLQERIRQVLGKAGVEIGGEFKSEYFSSTISGDGLNPTGRNAETNEYSSVDFDVIGRPNSSVSGQVIFRMHHNWQSFWSDPGNPIFSRWASIDGNFADKLRFHAGNFKALYSPLTLYAPEVDILFEPELFARRRVDAMNEEFLGGNARPLMGLTAGYDAPPLSVFDEVHFTILGARLRSIQTSLIHGDYIVNSFEDAKDFNKLCIGSNLETQIRKRLALGGSFLYIFDDKESFNNPLFHSDTAAQRTAIAAARAGYDLSKFCAMRDSSVRVYGEAAFSFDADAWYNSGDSNDLRRKTIKGSAAFGGITLQRTVRDVGFIGVDVKYVRNESNFRNELAQSPTFLGKRIMNIESDSLSPGVKPHVTPNHYSTFDALYNHVFKFCPSQETNLWEKAPFAKNAYTNNVYTQKRLAAIDAGMLDPSVQLVMPFGPATPNRQGVCADFSAQSIDTAVRFAGMLKLLAERSPEIYSGSATPAQFYQAGIGAQCNGAAYWKTLHYPLVLSLSQSRSSAHVPESGFAITSDFTNAACSFQFWKKTALLGGFQFIRNYFQNNIINLRQRQMHWSLGLSWQLAQGADVVGEIGRIMVESPNDLSVTRGPQRFSQGKYTQYIGSIMLKAGF